MNNLKSYLSILKTYLNNKKVSCIPPLLQDDKFITNLKEKAEVYNIYNIYIIHTYIIYIMLIKT